MHECVAAPSGAHMHTVAGFQSVVCASNYNSYSPRATCDSDGGDFAFGNTEEALIVVVLGVAERGAPE